MSWFFETPGMRCPKRPRSFLWVFRWEDYHDFEMVPGTLKNWGGFVGQWEFVWRCKACGARGRKFGVDDVHIVRLRDAGLVPEQ